jgi:hypothetical protein
VLPESKEVQLWVVVFADPPAARLFREYVRTELRTSSEVWRTFQRLVLTSRIGVTFNETPIFLTLSSRLSHQTVSVNDVPCPRGSPVRQTSYPDPTPRASLLLAITSI